MITDGSRGIEVAIVKQLVTEDVNIAFAYINTAECAQQIVKEVKKLNLRHALFKRIAPDLAAVQETLTVHTCLLLAAVCLCHKSALNELTRSIDTILVHGSSRSIQFNLVQSISN